MMAAPPGYSKACCTLPPVEAKYEPKGTFVEINGLKTYKTGNEDATTALILIYDVFGIGSQIQQGADILAHSFSSHTEKKEYQVYIPDFLEGQYAEPDWFPPDTPEKQQQMWRYFGEGGIGNPDSTTKKLFAFAEAIKAKKIGCVGYCWGAKVVAMACVEGTPFTAAAMCHPSSITVEEAPKIVTPLCVLASQDEDKELIEKFGEELKVPKFVDIYTESPHGWMTSRADLDDPKSKANYQKGYGAVLGFLHEHL